MSVLAPASWWARGVKLNVGAIGVVASELVWLRNAGTDRPARALSTLEPDETESRRGETNAGEFKSNGGCDRVAPGADE